MIELIQEDIMNNWGISNFQVLFDSVHCITYNHEHYI